MKKDILISIDIGSSNIKTVIFDSNFKILASESNEINILFPKPGWTEYNPDDWWTNVKDTLKRGASRINTSPDRISSISISGLGCCAIPVDINGNYIYNAIPWSDQRTQKEVDFLEHNCKELIFKASSNIPTRLSATPHLMWIKKNVPDIYKKTYKYTEASGFIGLKLTGEATLDFSMASGLDFGFNSQSLDYDENLITTMGLDIEKFPRLHKNTESIGNVSKNAAIETGLIEGIPVYIGGLDIISAILAAGVIYPNQGLYSMGSAANMMFVTDRKIASHYLQTYVHITDPKMRILNGSQGSIGYSLKWFRDQFGIVEQKASELLNYETSSFELMDIQANKTEPGSSGLIYFPFLFGKYHPTFSQTASGVFFGITSTTTKAKMIRSIMEGCTYNMYENVKSAQEIGIDLNEIIVSGGPSKSSIWCQIISDITNKKIITIKNTEGSPLGNAILASVGEGLFNGFEEAINIAVVKDRVYYPNKKNHNLYESLFASYLEIYESLIQSFDNHVKRKAEYNIV